MKLKITKQELIFLMDFLEKWQMEQSLDSRNYQTEIVRAAIREFIVKNVPRILSAKDSFKIKLSITEITMLDYCIQFIPENNQPAILLFKSEMIGQLNIEMLSIRSILDSPLNLLK